MSRRLTTKHGERALLLVLCVGAAACSNRDAVLGVVRPPGGQALRLSRDIQPIFTANCAVAFCHGSPLGGPMSLQSGDTYGSLVGIPSCEAPLLQRVEAGNSSASYLMVKLQGTQATVLASGGCAACSITGGSVANCGERMPLTGPPYLPDAEIQRIGEWIDQGAADN